MTEKNKFLLQQAILICCLTCIFTIIVFFMKSYYFSAWNSAQYIEENYIEPSIKTQEIELYNSWSTQSITNTWAIWSIENISLSWSIVSELIEKNYRSAAAYVFEYFPEEFRDESQDFSKTFSQLLRSKPLKKMIHNLHVQMHQELYDVRWKMKNRNIKLYWYQDSEQWEYLSVAVHELAHFIDIYFLEKKVLQDISDEFYDISWRETKIIKPWQDQSDFVSWYAMTNKYEDFAESFTYYVLHNDDFLRKTLSSDALSEKYDFFDKIIFKKIFTDTDFSTHNDVLEYYRDITKIDIDVEKLLQYLKNWI